MKKISYWLRIVILAFSLFILSISLIIIKGNTYTVRIDNKNEVSSVKKINVIIEDDSILKCVSKNMKDGKLEIKFKSLSKGKTYVVVNNTEQDLIHFPMYVHSFGVITFNEYMGDCNGGIVIPISIIIFSIYILSLLCMSFVKNRHDNMYQYKNIAYLGIIICVIISVISQLLSLPTYHGLISIVNSMSSMFLFTTIIFPVAFIVSLLVIISNISLIRKEGFRLRNLLGVVLGVGICFSSLLPELMYRMLYSATWIDIHNQNGMGLYIYNLIESIIIMSLTYIECILIGTIIISIKAAKHVPKFDKDCIIILGCKIMKDGSLTKLLQGRVDRAIEFSKMQKEMTGKDILFVPSGGKGSDEVISEAQAMKNYLIDKGIKPNRIIIEDKSKNTFENIKFSNKLINDKIKNAKIALSTTNYHVFRAGTIATDQNISIEGIGAKTKSYFWINAFIREFIATIFLEKKKHFLMFCLIVVVALFVVMIQYLFTTL